MGYKISCALVWSIWLGLSLSSTLVGQVLWNVERELPTGVYVGGDSPEVWIGGGNIVRTEDGYKPMGGPPIAATIGRGSDVSGLTIHVENATLIAKGCRFSNCVFDLSWRGNLSFESCILTECRVKDPKVVDPSLSPMKNIPTMEFKNCVIMMSNEPGAVWAIHSPKYMLLKWDHCSLIGGSDSQLMMFPSVSGQPEDVASDANARGGYLRSCHFSLKMVPASMVTMTNKWLFEIEGLSTSLGTEVTAQHPVVGRFKPASLHSYVREQCPEISLTIMDDDEKVGSSLKVDPRSSTSPELQIATSAQTAFSKVVPPYTPTNSPPTARGTPGMPGGPSSGAVAASTSRHVTGSSGAPDIELKANQAAVHGLLIVSLDRGEAGSASRMSAIALDHDKSLSSEVKFNQPVGDMMSKALVEVGKFTQLRNKGWPKGYQIELSFADKYSGKDGPSAAVACALLLNSLITGKANDLSFAVTGDMNADGTVQPIGGVAAKIRGATGGKCKIVAIPVKNEKSLGDLLLTDGPAPFVGIQIYSISHFDEAEALALADRPPQVQEAINQMQQVQDVLLRNKAQMGGWLKNPHVIAKLQAVLQAAPNHLSAKYLLMYGTGKIPTTLSLAGSIDAVEHAAAELIAAIKANKGQDANALRKDVVGSSITRLQNLRARCDMRVRAYADAIIRYGSIIKDAQDRPANSASRYNQIMASLEQSVGAVQSEWKNLINNPQVREELEE